MSDANCQSIAAQVHSYGGVAAEYQRGRPSYALAAVDELVAKLAWSESHPVLDLGAGTGTLSKLLVEKGIKVVAVEPVAKMRAKITESPRLRVVDGRADSIPVFDGRFGSAVVATAFHWFANVPALREIKRVTQPPHQLALIWNDRDHTVPWVQSFDAVLEPYAQGAPRYISGEWRRVFDDLGIKVGGQRSFPNPQSTTRDRVVDRGMSTSFIASLPPEERNAVQNALRDLTSGLPENLIFPYTTDLYVVELGDTQL